MMSIAGTRIVSEKYRGYGSLVALVVPLAASNERGDPKCRQCRMTSYSMSRTTFSVRRRGADYVPETVCPRNESSRPTSNSLAPPSETQWPCSKTRAWSHEKLEEVRTCAVIRATD